MWTARNHRPYLNKMSTQPRESNIELNKGQVRTKLPKDTMDTPNNRANKRTRLN